MAFLSNRVSSLLQLNDSSPSPSLYIIQPCGSIVKKGEDSLLATHQFLLDAHGFIQGHRIHPEGFAWLLYPTQWKEFSQSEQADVREPLLWMTMDLERSLGNILFSLRQPVPHLLKDIVRSESLREVIGDVHGDILVSLMGSPESLNIRNLLWHGFLSHGDLHPAYLSGVILLAHSIGLSLKSFPLRKRGFSPCLSRVELFKNDTELPFQVDDDDLSLRRILDLHKQGSYDLSLMLFLPYLESRLRRLYTEVNNCPARILTAESDRFYTTFDEILAAEMIGNDESLDVNRLREHFGDPLLEFYHDIFILPDGPRLRDRLSHGEYPLFSQQEKFKRPLNLLLESLLHPSNMSSYASIFHPFSLLFQRVSSATEEVMKSGPIIMEKGLPSNINSYSPLYAPKRHVDLVRVLIKITEAIEASALAMNENRVSTLDKMKRKTLRSRQRLTAERMLSVFESLRAGQMDSLCYVLLVFGSRDVLNFDEKNLRRILSLHQNINTWVKTSENRWDRVEGALLDLRDLLRRTEEKP
eukprot:TRINITY_DN2529_c0_g1_i1.p1 TRINITY_DN2529_c0_g1~~TRINITY_DN2529_c0_g1_i1.p1  ORF type:complete len:527 (+),score=62.75 TRINITY_DN2529_c0_g1_i1:894-2474(+)